MLKVLEVMGKLEKKPFTYCVLGTDEIPLYLHIDNHKTKSDSVLIPIGMVKRVSKLIQDLEN